MAKKNFRIVIDGVEHFVEVEEIASDHAAPVAAVTRPTAAPVAVKPVASTPKPTASPAAGNGLSAPLQGTVLDIPVKAGDAVKAGDILVIIEAMKMENEIVAPGDAVIDAVHANKGDNVRAGDLLVSFR